jgi:hypothetical protein
MYEAMRRDRFGHEGGAIIVQAALIMVVLLGFSAFVVDYGMFWVSRAQAQHAADAGALAGGLARAYDYPTANVPPANTIITVASQAVVAQNPVWFEAPSSVVEFPCPRGIRCVRVNVYRNGALGSTALPLVFGGILGLTSQGVRATATAQVWPGNSTTCMKPWAIPDRWVERRPGPSGWTEDDVFERYAETGPNAGELLPLPVDEFEPHAGESSGSGLLGIPVSDGGAVGLLMTLRFLNPHSSPDISPGSLLPLDLPGGTSYEQDIAGCNGNAVGPGRTIPTGSPGNQGATSDGAAALIAADPAATWNSATNTVENSCAPVCAPVSPRLIALALFDVDEYQHMRASDNWCAGNVRCVKVANIAGFFLQDVVDGDPRGYFARHPGLLSTDYPSLPQASSFLPAVTLVR